MRERLVDIWRSLRREKGAMLGLALIVLVLFMAVLAPLAPYAPKQRDADAGMAPPSSKHWLGR